MKQNSNLLKIARINKSWTPDFVSGRVGVSLSTYARWEAGLQMPRPASLHILCEVFEMSPGELGFTQPDNSEGRSAHSKHSRRQEANKEQSEHRMAGGTERIESLSNWEIGVDSCWQWYLQGAQTELERMTPTYLKRLAEIAHYPGPEQLKAASLTSQMHQLVALLNLQRGNFTSAQEHCTQALVYSQLAKDWNAYVAAQIRLAGVFTARKRIGPTLIAYNDALRQVNVDNNHVSPILHSWIFAGLAEIQAAMGNEQEALQFLKVAFTVFPIDATGEPGLVYAQCDYSLLYLYQGLVFLRLGQPKLAWDALAQVDDLQPPPDERIRAEFLKHRAYTSFMLGNMIQACVYLEAAVKTAQEVESDFALGEAYTIYEHLLAAWGQEPRVRALAQLFQK